MTSRLAATFVLTLLLVSPAVGEEAELILSGGRIWTGDDEHPWAEAVAIAGERLIAVGRDEEVAAHAGTQTRSVDLAGRFVAPGFIDNHTHFNRAGDLLLGINLLDADDDETLVRRVEEAQKRLPEGAWIVGGDWSAYNLESTWRPHRDTIEPSTSGRNPLLLAKWDRSLYLANAMALEAAGAGCDWEGVECDAGGEMTGRLTRDAGDRVRQAMPEKSLDQRLAEARLALARLAGHGVTTIHDITPATQLHVYQELLRRGELTTRIYARPTLDKWEHLARLGIRHGFGDDWIRIGGLKGFVDGIMGNSSARFYEPYLTSGKRGEWRDMMRPDGNMQKLLIGADAAGHWPQVHAIGDEAIDHLLDLYEGMIEVNGPRERRLRIIHTQVLRNADVAARMARLGIIAEVQPYHAIDDMRWMEPRIGDRARWAYAFRTLQEAGVRLSFGSDWPGTNASWYPSRPMLGIYAAVTRQTLEGQPAQGWFPEERIDLESALHAYTTSNAWVAGEEGSKGRLAPGLLADLVVLDRNPFEIPAAALKDVGVEVTLVGGRIVHGTL